MAISSTKPYSHLQYLTLHTVADREEMPTGDMVQSTQGVVAFEMPSPVTEHP